MSEDYIKKICKKYDLEYTIKVKVDFCDIKVNKLFIYNKNRTSLLFQIYISSGFYDCGTKLATSYYLKEGYANIANELLDSYKYNFNTGDFFPKVNLLTTCAESKNQRKTLKALKFKKLGSFNNPNYGNKKDRGVFIRESK